ncbi:MAG: type VI secretion system contractile sheath large subunit [Gemmataceae bacterium]
MSEIAQQKSANTTTTTDSGGSLLDQILTGPMKSKDDAQKERNKQFISAVIDSALNAAPGSVVAGDIERTIQAWKAEIDRKLSAQLNEVLHHPEFQKLEGTWRGLNYLVKESETSATLKIRVLNVSKKTLSKDLERAIEFDQSTLFKKIYEAEYGTLGGHPFGMLIGDYEFDGKSAEDVGMLQKIAGVAGAAHAPFVASAGADMFNLESMTDLNNPRDLDKIFQSIEYAAWKSFRESEDSRYVALTMPRVLSRLPYGRGLTDKPIEEFNYEEGIDGTDHEKYAWMNSAWAFGARVTNAFAKDGWFMRTRGVENGGQVENLPLHVFNEAGGKTAKCPTEVLIPDRREAELSGLGFLPLLHYKDSDKAVFIGTQTTQKPKKFFDNAANSNAELSTKLNYMLCVSRFAHYLKAMARDKLGSFAERTDMELWLNNWIQNYVVPNPEDVGDEIKAKCPLQSAQITVTSVKGKPGWYQAVAHLRPHFQLEGLATSMRLVAELPQNKK